MFEVNNFTQRYDDHLAVDNVSFKVQKGTIMGLIGTNGAGKTTIVKAASGLLEATNGRFTIFGNEIKDNRKKYIRSLGAVLEGNRNIYMRLSPEENMKYFAKMRNVKKQEYVPRINKLLKDFELESKRTKECNSLSRGMQQKVAICCSIIHNPKIIFLDEPTLGLDFESVKTIEDIILKSISEEKIIIITSHDLDFITRIVNHVVVINKGKKILDSPVNGLKLLRNKNYFEILIPKNEKIFEDSRIVEIITKDEGKLVRFEFKHHYEISNIIDKFKENSISIITMHQNNYSLSDLYMDLVSNNSQIRGGGK